MFHINIKSKKSIHLSTFKFILLFALSTLILTGCISKTMLMDNDKSDAEEIDFLVLTTPFINPDNLDRPSPIRLDLFQLLDKSEFAYADYLNLIDEENHLNNEEDEQNGEKNDLNGDLIDRNQYIFQPDDINSMTFKVNKDTKYIGIAAGYQDITQSEWKLILFKQPIYWSNSKNYLYLKIDQNEIVQLSKQEMREELKQYAEQHPDSEKVTKSGRFKKPKLDYTKGIFAEQ